MLNYNLFKIYDHVIYVKITIMDLCALFVIAVLVINPTESVYRISRQAVSWSDAFNHCQEFGGHLATLEYLENFRHQVRTNLTDFIFENGMELWVGANLKATDWKWEGETEHTFNGDKQFYENKGCFHQQFWYSGTQVNNMSPELCLKMCNWKGAVGLKKDFCLCEKDLRNISTIELGVCHFKCTGSTSDMCGGLYGVSVYQPAKRTIFWAEAEPKDDDDCVLVRRKDTESKVDLITSKCQRQTRYLCSFSNDDKCGKYNTCLRWSTHHATWEDAKTNCKAMNGQLAEVDDARMDYMRDLNRLPPGSFWLALRRRRNWQWLTGTPVSPLDFYGHERGTTSERQCAVIQNINGKVGLAARTCELKKTYLCQYDFMKRDGSNSALPPALNSTDISSPPTGLKTTVNSPMDGKGRNDDTDNIGVRAGTNKNLDQDRNDMEPNAEPSSASEEKGLLNTCMFVVLGFVSGMVCVLILGMIVYAIYRCNQPKLNNKHSRLESHRTHPDHQSKHSVSYSSKEDSIHLTVAPPPSDVTYASVYDQGESPFRRTQRIIRMGSANSWRHAQPRKPRHDTIDSTGSDYTWRGMIGGKVEIINTELRQQNSDQSNTSTHPYGDIGYDLRIAETRSRTSPDIVIERNPFNIKEHTDNEEMTHPDANEGIYDLPGPSNVRPKVTENKDNYQPDVPERQYPSFLELESKLDELSNEENIYATIKKTFQKMQEDALENKNDNEDAMMYTVKLN